MATLETIPQDIFLEIWSYLDPHDRLKMRQINRGFSHNQVVKRHFKRHIRQIFDPNNLSLPHYFTFTPGSVLRLAAISKNPRIASKIQTLVIEVDVPNLHGLEVLGKRVEAFNNYPGYKRLYKRYYKPFLMPRRPHGKIYPSRDPIDRRYNHPNRLRKLYIRYLDRHLEMLHTGGYKAALRTAFPNLKNLRTLRVEGDMGSQFLDYLDTGKDVVLTEGEHRALSRILRTEYGSYTFTADMDGLPTDAEWPAHDAYIWPFDDIDRSLLHADRSFEGHREDNNRIERTKAQGLSLAIGAILPALAASGPGKLDKLVLGQDNGSGAAGLWSLHLSAAHQQRAPQAFRRLTRLYLAVSDYRSTLNASDLELSPAQAAKPLRALLAFLPALQELELHGSYPTDNHNGALESALSGLHFPALHNLYLENMELVSNTAIIDFITAHGRSLKHLSLEYLTLEVGNPSWWELLLTLGEGVDLVEYAFSSLWEWDAEGEEKSHLSLPMVRRSRPEPEALGWWLGVAGPGQEGAGYWKRLVVE